MSLNLIQLAYQVPHFTSQHVPFQNNYFQVQWAVISFIIIIIMIIIIIIIIIIAIKMTIEGLIFNCSQL